MATVSNMHFGFRMRGGGGGARSMLGRYCPVCGKPIVIMIEHGTVEPVELRDARQVRCPHCRASIYIYAKMQIRTPENKHIYCALIDMLENSFDARDVRESNGE